MYYGNNKSFIKIEGKSVTKYIIKEIYADGYERFAVLEGTDIGKNLIVHFLEFDEYLENGRESEKKKVGDIIEGDMSIDLVTVIKRIDKEIMHEQTIEKSSHIEAIVEICQIVDDYSVYAFSSVSNNEILIEFESAVDYKEGDRIFIAGSLEMNKIEKQ